MRTIRRTGLGLALALGVFVVPGLVRTGGAVAAGDARLSVAVERDASEPPRFSELHVPVRVTVTDRDSGAPPTTRYEVYVTAVTAAGERTEAFPSFQRSETDPTVKPGIYLATLILPHAGPWRLEASVNRYRVDESAPPVVLAAGAGSVDVAGTAALDSAVIPSDREPAGGSARTVAFLWAHSLVGAGWALAVLLLLGQSLPGGRRLLSEWGAHVVDRAVEPLIRAVWGFTAAVVVTGLYNLRYEVPYKTPFSPGAARRVFRLPFAEPYFLSLSAKLAAYTLMVAATVPLIREARRRIGAGVDGGGGAAGEEPSPWEPLGGPAAGRVAVAERTAPSSTRTVADREDALRPIHRVVTVALVVGGAVLWAGVVLIKYFHVLSEGARL